MSESKPTVGVVGLGSMGRGMALSLARAGFDVTGCDPATSARAEIEAASVRAVAAVGDLPAGLGAIVCVVVNAAQTEAVLFADGGAAERLAPGGLFMACSTVPAAFAERAAATLAERGLGYLDAPISGGAAKAAEGALSIMAAAPDDVFERAAPLLDAMAENVFRIGDRAGQGSAMKMINQLLAGVHIAAAGEAMALAVRIGLDPQQTYDTICRSAGMSWMFENRVPRLLAGEYRPHSAVDIFTKDLGIVLDTAGAADFPTPLSAAAHQLFTMAASAGMGRWDDMAVAKVYEALSDIELPGPAPGAGETPSHS